jgi:PhzF family phenazine biosynthesis protein
MNSRHRFEQVDVFGAAALRGNPVAVVFDADSLSDAQMQDVAQWTHLSETTFLLPPRDPRADFRLRIFTPGGELPFAGHPTLGSCHAWLEAGGLARDNEIVQECGAGLVRIRRDGSRLAFEAPPRRRQGPADADTVLQVARCLRLAPDQLRAVEWVDNGPGWLAALLPSAEAVLALEPDFAAMRPLALGVVGSHPPGHACAFEVRAFVPGLGVAEDPVTGSLNAGIAQWLIEAGLAPDRYVVSQGARMGRAGRVHLERIGGAIWVGGDAVTCVLGELRLPH